MRHLGEFLQRNVYSLGPRWARGLVVIIQSQIEGTQETLESESTELWNLSNVNTN